MKEKNLNTSFLDFRHNGKCLCWYVCNSLFHIIGLRRLIRTLRKIGSDTTFSALFVCVPSEYSNNGEGSQAHLDNIGSLKEVSSERICALVRQKEVNRVASYLL